MIAIVNYGMGNVGSVKNAFLALGAEVLISSSPDDFARASHLVLPGVGAFKDGMQKLQELGLASALQEEVFNKKKPFLGICLGMQVLAEEGEEGGRCKGLGWLAGRVRRFQIDEKKFHLPHVGWNDVVPAPKNILFRGVSSPIFYFVHSYFFVPENPDFIAAICEYGEKFSAAVQHGNIFGVQFHPEKSQKSGLALLRNFMNFF